MQQKCQLNKLRFFCANWFMKEQPFHSLDTLVLFDCIHALVLSRSFQTCIGVYSYFLEDASHEMFIEYYCANRLSI